MREKVCLFIGSHRPSVYKRDSGEDLLRSLIIQGVNVSAVYVRPDDNIQKKAFKNCRVCSIPQIMRQTRKKIIQSFENGEFSEDWSRWLSKFRSERYSLGIVYFGSWLPPELFNSPELGFINFHPGPLPALRGFEAETWAVLNGMSNFYGTVHRVNKEYDEGEILWKTPIVKIRKKETPDSLLKRTCYAGINYIYKIVKKLHYGEIVGARQQVGDGFLVTTNLVSQMARIDWTRDSIEVLQRKNRAFNGQYISIPLVVNFNEEERIVKNLTAIPGKYEGGLGEYLGMYSKRGSFENKEMFQALDGIVVFDFLPTGEKKPTRATVFSEYQDSYKIPQDT